MLKIKDNVDLKELEKFGFYCDEEIVIEEKKYDVWVKSVFTEPRDYSEINKLVVPPKTKTKKYQSSIKRYLWK